MILATILTTILGSIVGFVLGTYLMFKLYNVKFSKANILDFFDLMKMERGEDTMRYLGVKNVWYNKIIYYPNILSLYLDGK